MTATASTSSASTSSSSPNTSTSTAVTTDLNDVIRLCWGVNVKEDIFQRWTQGFQFSPDESTALVQYEGGPCAVLAPAQAFIFKNIVETTQNPVNDNWRTKDVENCNKLLIHALVEMLNQAVEENSFQIIYLDSSDFSNTTEHISFQQFHSKLRIQPCANCDEIEQFYNQKIELLHNRFGVLLFLYSVLCSKGLPRLRLEVSDISEPLIDPEFGYGNQSLINLMITGRAVNYVFDHTQDIDGLKLQGIDKQSQIGFLTLLEHLRYCEVGSYLKNPVHPIWVLGSETHLTVTFSFEKRLASIESPADKARRIFKSFDPDGNNFIACEHLQNLLDKLDLVSDINYVGIMQKKLDPDELGIILLSTFMDEFFGDPEKPPPDLFDIYHYNGLARSNFESKVMYRMAHCVLLECNISYLIEANSILTCLQTKWPSIEVNWINRVIPSLN